MKVTVINYGQFLLNSHCNFTGTYFANTVNDLEHDSVYRYLKSDNLTPRMVWEKTKPLIKRTSKGVLIFDDTVLDKNASRKIGATRSQYSGNAHPYNNVSELTWSAKELKQGKLAKVKGFPGSF